MQCDARLDDPQELIRRMLSRDEGAWRDFSTRYARVIYRCITKVTTKFSSFVRQADVEDIHSQLLVQLLAHDMIKLRSFDPERGKKFSSWIGLLAINAAYDHLRAVRRSVVALAPVDELAEMISEDGPSPVDVIEHHEQAAMLRSAVVDLSERDRQFVELYYTDGLEPEQIATRMQISVKTVYSKKHKIEAHLGEMLADAA